MKARNLLKSFQGGYLRAVIETMKTTSTKALEMALSFSPLRLVIISITRQTAFRIKSQGEKTRLSHIRLDLSNRPFFTLKQYRIPRKHLMEKTFNI